MVKLVEGLQGRMWASDWAGVKLKRLLGFQLQDLTVSTTELET